ncbi:MAG: PIN domain-containing protein [Sphingomonadaceae bacterium]
MLRYLLDTNLCVCVRVLRDRPACLRDRFNAEADGLCIYSILLYELLKGAAKSARPQYHRQEVERFASRLAVLPFDAEAADHAGDIRATLERRGRVIGAYDLLIAGHARSRGLTVVTNNLPVFACVEGLLCKDWEARAPDRRAPFGPGGRRRTVRPPPCCRGSGRA